MYLFRLPFALLPFLIPNFTVCQTTKSVNFTETTGFFLKMSHFCYHFMDLSIATQNISRTSYHYKPEYTVSVDGWTLEMMEGPSLEISNHPPTASGFCIFPYPSLRNFSCYFVINSTNLTIKQVYLGTLNFCKVENFNSYPLTYTTFIVEKPNVSCCVNFVTLTEKSGEDRMTSYVVVVLGMFVVLGFLFVYYISLKSTNRRVFPMHQ